MAEVESLLLMYASKKEDIAKRLQEFELKKYAPDEEIFAELVFCILTPQTRASQANKALSELQNGPLFKGSEKEIAEVLAKNGIRFHNRKAKYIIKARELFSRGNKIKIKSMLNTDDPKGLRAWLASNVLGLGYKEASHFLRNIGYGKDLAILDRHILSELLKLKIISKMPKSLSKSKYLEIEQKLTAFAAKLKLSLAELDALLWSEHGSLPIDALR